MIITLPGLGVVCAKYCPKCLRYSYPLVSGVSLSKCQLPAANYGPKLLTRKPQE